MTHVPAGSAYGDVTPADLKSGELDACRLRNSLGRSSYGDQGVTGRGPNVDPSPHWRLGWLSLHTGFSASFFWGSFFLRALRSVRRCSAVVSAA